MRDLTRLDLITEAVRAALEEAAGASPRLLDELADEDWGSAPAGSPEQEPHQTQDQSPRRRKRRWLCRDLREAFVADFGRRLAGREVLNVGEF
ncbi:hypothetical protein [Streptomyces sp. WAC 06783]|uniref:hypothetical protein n=1 Tax=Streptomyces sp. WAC 06783 TaxID=2203211 RepID=UPI0021AD6EFA|nr:hypothetical protein [Streptomyces sp. WAC 06783]